MDPEDDAPPDVQRRSNVAAMSVWDQVIADMEATASDLESSGWTTLETHPGDVTVAQNRAEPGLDAVLPGNEFRSLEELLESGVRFSEYEVFRAEGDTFEYALLVAEDPQRETAILLPLFYEVEDLIEVLQERPEILPVYLRRLDGETVSLELTEPELLLPAAEETPDETSSEASDQTAGEASEETSSEHPEETTADEADESTE